LATETIAPGPVSRAFRAAREDFSRRPRFPEDLHEPLSFSCGFFHQLENNVQSGRAGYHGVSAFRLRPAAAGLKMRGNRAYREEGA
jgi:hypothetical protein